MTRDKCQKENTPRRRKASWREADTGLTPAAATPFRVISSPVEQKQNVLPDFHVTCFGK